jgi:cell division septation protein DedD
VAAAPRALAELGTRPRRHHRPKLGFVLGAALAGWATILPVNTAHWPLLVASSAPPVPAPQSLGGAPAADSVVVPVPAAASTATPDMDSGAAANASGGSPSQTLGARLEIAAAAEVPAPGTSLPSATGLEATTKPAKPLLDDHEHLRAQATARSQRSPSLAQARAAPPASLRYRQIVLQLSSYNDQARARQAAATLHRALLKILRGAPVRAEQAEVHGKRVWRVVAGPVATRERGKQLCDAMHHAGQSCMVMLL